MTRFQQRVYDAARLIPRGKVTTYGLLAAHIGCASARAVGQALRRNPFAPEVPCHRVVCADFALGGFEGATGGRAVQRKVARLRREGVAVAGGRVASRAFLFAY